MTEMTINWKDAKSFSMLLIVILAFSSLIMAKPAFAQTPTPSTIPTPSVPEFTVKFVGSLSVPLTTDTLPSVNITIKNQPFTPYTDQDGNKINLYYLIQWKENSSNAWQQDELPLTESNSESIQFYHLLWLILRHPHQVK